MVSAHTSEQDAGNTWCRQTIWNLNFLEMPEFSLVTSLSPQLLKTEGFCAKYWSDKRSWELHLAQTFCCILLQKSCVYMLPQHLHSMCGKFCLALEKSSVSAASLWGDFGLKEYLCMQHSNDIENFFFHSLEKGVACITFLPLLHFCPAYKDPREKKWLKS